MPDSDIILFDGHCVLCSRSVDFLLRRDVRGRYRFAASQSASGVNLLKASGLEQAGSVILIRQGFFYSESCAAIRILSGLGGLWQLCHMLLFIPRPVRNMVYRMLAHNRYKWFGARANCRLPVSALEKERFI
ncbi:MAG: thiol-disulfide oxidoreductase DCC family protein [Bacteroidota bacterium]